MDSDSTEHFDGGAQHRWVGFVDLLGYRNLVLCEKRSDAERIRLIKSIYSALIQPIDDLNSDEAMGDTVGGDRVERIHFSDCFYFFSKSAVAVANSMASFFSSAFLLYETVYQRDASSWIPFLRGGIAGGWTLTFRDPTVRTGQGALFGDWIEQARPTAIFRNPVGPSVAKAYMVSEEQHVSGMRLLTTGDFAERYQQEMASMKRDANGMIAQKLTPQPIDQTVIEKHRKILGEKLYEIPWPRCLEFGHWIENFANTRKRQFDPESMKHWDATYALLLRSARDNNDQLILRHLKAINQDL